jgi:TrmH family RNA methyltransferase
MIEIPPLSQNKLKHIRKLKQKKYRVDEKYFFCEGFRLFAAAMQAQAQISEIVLSQEILQKKMVRQIIRFAAKHNILLYKCTPNQFKTLSEEKTPAGILFLVRSIFFTSDELADITDPAIVYLEKIAEPGNLGAIIRSAVWFGVKSILLSPGCVDSTNPKAVRASAGALFSCKIYQDISIDMAVTQFRQRDYIFTAAALENSVPISEWSPAGKDILCFGAEATGLTKEVLNQCDHIVTIPGHGDVESLNLAVSAGIFLYKLTTI